MPYKKQEDRDAYARRYREETNYDSKYYAQNRERRRAQQKAWREANAEHVKARNAAWRKANPFKRYGITAEQHADMVAAQRGLCAICQEKMAAGDIHVDHNHATNKLRGMLHAKCNRALGMFGDNPALLRAAADYLEKHK